MKYAGLLSEVKVLIPTEVVKEYHNIYMRDRVPISDSLKSCRDDYYKIIGEYWISNGNNDYDFMDILQEKGFLGKIDINNVEKVFEYIRIALLNFQRYMLLKTQTDLNSFEQKINFVLSNNRYFNLFREYDIPNFGKFVCKPSNLEEINIFINNYKRSFIQDSVLPPFDGMDPYYGTERVSFILSITNTTCKEVAIRYLDKLNDRIDKVDSRERYIACYEIMELLIKKNIEINEFIKSVNIPILYFIILPLKKSVEDVIKFKEFLLSFTWEEQKEFILNTQNNAIEIVLVDPSNRWPIHNESGKYTIRVTSDSEVNFYENLKKSKIFIQDVKLIQNIIAETRRFLNNMNYVSIELINDQIDFIQTELEKLITPRAETNFKNHFLNAFSKKEIADFNPEVWNKFKELLPFNQAIQNRNNVKIKTNLSAKQLALFIRILFESDLIDNNSHKVQPLLKLISENYSSIDTAELSINSLNKNYYAKDNHADLKVLEAKLRQMLSIIKKMQDE